MKDLIIGLRGGVPDKCDWCGTPITEETAEPEEAGQWVCGKCWLSDGGPAGEP